MKILKKLEADFVAMAVVLTVFSAIVLNVEAEGVTLVDIDPSSQVVAPESYFSVNVSCAPGQPIKMFELNKLYFDASLLQVKSVTEGDIFDGYNTLFHQGTINNVAGCITNVYGLIIGQGNVSDNGSLITISFTALQNTGSSSLNLSGVGVSDEFGYIPVNVYDGSVSVLRSSGENPPGDDNGNNAPGTPLTPDGPSSVETGDEYVFETSSFDVDGNMIRFRFDWGDGNLSNWSEYVDSNVSVSISHSWTYVSSFEVRVIAQDENGLNSSWSLPLNVTVIQAVSGGSPPFGDIEVNGNAFVNGTIVFDASDSFDLDGFIFSFYWDFGDGENGSGIRTSHVYKNPGEYEVTLIVVDNDGNENITSQIISINSGINDSEEVQGILPFTVGIVIVGILTSFFLVLTIFFREKIILFFSTFRFPNFSNINKYSKKSKIEKIDEKIQKMKGSFE